MKDVVLQLLDDAGQATQSSSDIKVKGVIRAVVDQSVGKSFQSSALKAVLKTAVKNRLTEAQVVNKVATGSIKAQPLQ